MLPPQIALPVVAEVVAQLAPLEVALQSEGFAQNVRAPQTALEVAL